MANADKEGTNDSRENETWREHNLSQLLYFRSLSLREKLDALEGMAEIVRLLERMRERKSERREK